MTNAVFEAVRNGSSGVFDSIFSVSSGVSYPIVVPTIVQDPALVVLVPIKRVAVTKAQDPELFVNFGRGKTITVNATAELDI